MAAKKKKRESLAKKSDAELQVWIDGKLFPKSQAKISAYDHGFLYGDGVFEGIRAYNGKVFRLEQHIDRLYNSAKSILLHIPMARSQLCREILRTLQTNNLHNSYIRVVVTRGVGDLGLDPRKCAKPSIVIITDHIHVFPQELYEKGIDMITASTRRNSPQVLNPNIKNLNYLNNVLAKIEANLAGKAEALMLDVNGFVCEGTGENIFIVKHGRLLTPPSYVGILAGITRQAVMDLAKKINIPYEEYMLTPHDIYNADECFLTGTGAEIMPVITLDNRSIGTGNVGQTTRTLIQKFRELTKKEGTLI